MSRDCIKVVRRSLYNTSIPELMYLSEVCGLDDIDSIIIIDGFAHRHGNIEIGLKVGMCQDAIAKRKRRIIEKVYQYRLFVIHQKSIDKFNI